MTKLIITLLLFLGSLVSLKAQYTTLNAHSHNDYEQKSPFFTAYNAHFGSIEADIWAVNGVLYVAHDSADIKPSRTLESLYLQPIVKLFRQNGGKAWKNHASTFQLLIDLKTGTEPTLSLLVKLLGKYPDVFGLNANKIGVPVVITGNRPNPSDFEQYPLNISFDGHLDLRYDNSQLKRVALFSEDLEVFTLWKGKTSIPQKEEKRLTQIIDSVHGLNKKIRFWDAPDTPDSWKTLMNLKVDYLNTDHIQQLETYLQTHKN